MTSEPHRHSRIRSLLHPLLAELSGFAPEDLDASITFLEMGFESLMLIQLSQSIHRTFDIKVSFRQLIEQIETLDGLVVFLDAHLSPEALLVSEPVSESPAPMVPKPVALPSSAPMPRPNNLSDTGLPIAPALEILNGHGGGAAPQVTRGMEAIMQQQLQIMSLQLEALRGAAVAMPQNGAVPPRAELTTPKVDAIPVTEPPAADTTSFVKALQRQRFGPYKPIKRGVDGQLTTQQQQHLAALIQRVNQRTPGSKALAQQHRPHFADPRGVAGFRKIWKEMVYQIAVERSRGSRLWDVDGNVYIDLAMGFGLNLFGHHPEFIAQALLQQLDKGIEIGPQCPLAGEVARRLCDLTGMERATFCNTGSEAVMAALRVARTVHGKDKFVCFNQSYHGTFDQVLIRSTSLGGQRRMLPAAPGVPQCVADEAIVLDYGDPQALDVIRSHASELAAVLVEPVQSGNLGMQPREFLHDLRRLTSELDIALIMDEMISGFRAGPGGAQAWFGVQGDMATYGKVLGGGLPIGALAGRARYLDALDSGMWGYGDDSVPEQDMTFFAGTFVRHPLALAAAHAVLTRIEAEGPALQQQLTARTTALVDALNGFFEHRGVPIRLLHFASQFRFAFPAELEYIDLLYYHLLARGIFTRGFQENCFISTAHTDEDINAVIKAIQDSVVALQDGGFLPAPPDLLAPSDALADPPGDHTPNRSEPVEPTLNVQFPLSEAQTEIWLASQMGDIACAAFNEPMMLVLRGPLQVGHMRAAIQTVLARHVGLHMRFSPQGDYQVRGIPKALDIPLVDVSDGQAETQQQGVQAVLDAMALEPFDLVHGPLVRVHIVKRSAGDHVIAFAAHHIVCDGWSTVILLEEIAAAYTASCQSRPYRLPIPHVFSTYVLEQNARQQRQGIEDEYRYWTQQLEPPPMPLELPTDRPRPALKTYRGGTAHETFDAALHGALKRLAADCGVSVFALMLAAFNVLLARLAGQEDFVVTIPTAGQALSGMDRLVGHCVNFLPLRTRVPFDGRFIEVLRQTQTRLLEAYDYAECTFGGILKRIRMPRQADRIPLSEIVFNVDRRVSGLDFHDLDIEVLQVPKQAVVFEIFMNISELDHGGGLSIDCDYNRDLYDETTMRRWIRQYENLLRGIVAQADQRLDAMPLLRPDEREQMLVAWNQTHMDYPRDMCVHEGFEARAARVPEAVAAIDHTAAITYAELNARANQVAHYLHAQGVVRGTRVGLCMERSVDLIAGALGILKAGGAYVPLDPHYPHERLALMLNDAEVPIVLTCESVAAAVPGPIATICLDRDWPLMAAASQVNPDNCNRATDVAYVIYTSGSTGRPKGVEGTHRGAMNRCHWMWSAYPFAADEVCCQKTSVNFVDAVWEMFGPLLQGIPTVYVPEADVKAPHSLIAVLAAHRVSRIVTVPSLLQVMLETAPDLAERLPALTFWTVSGEALSAHLCQRFQQAVPRATLLNLYGSSEVAADATCYDASQHDVSRPVPIGRPIANTQVYLLDARQQPVPIGVAGEMYIGGDGLATGYLGRDALTRERFVRHAVMGAAEQRLYRTGDMGRYLPDGNLEFLGRRDQQVKLRGVRIELGEIEAALLAHPSLVQCAALVWDKQHQPAGAKIVAYLVSAQGERLSTSAWRDFLRSALPDIMIPSAFVYLDALPLTPNGKLDRTALPEPEFERPASGMHDVVSPTLTEQQVSGIWQTLLGVACIGVHDDFFHLGGHSLLAVQAVNRIRDAMQIELPVTSIFERPTVALLAQRIEAMQFFERSREQTVDDRDREVIEL